jgi:hypothetical protein
MEIRKKLTVGVFYKNRFPDIFTLLSFEFSKHESSVYFCEPKN